MKKIIVAFYIILLTSKMIGQNDSIVRVHFIYPIAELDSLTEDLQLFPGQAMFDIIYARIPLRFTITDNAKIENISELQNSKLVITSFTGQPHNEKLIKKYFIEQAIEICKMTESLWIPSKKNGIYISDTISHTFEFRVKRITKTGQNKVFTDGNNFIDTEYDNQSDNTSYTMAKIYKEVRKSINTSILGQRFYKNSNKYTKKNELLISEILLDLAKLKIENVDLYYDLGVVKFKLEKKNEACDNFNLAVMLGDKQAADVMKKYCK